MSNRYGWIGLVTGLALGVSSVGAAAQTRSAPPEPQPPPIQARPGSPESTPQSTYDQPVAKGSRLVLTNNAGDVVIRAWDQDRLKVEASHSPRETLDVSQENESTIRVRTLVTPASGSNATTFRPRPRGGSGLVDYRISVPRWMSINLSGTYLDADVEGTAAEVTVETVGGNVRVSGGSGAVSVRSIEGTIIVEKTTGRVQASAVKENITLSGTQGEVVADTITGDVIIDNAQTSSLDVSTVNGDIVFNGSVRDNGVYRLTTHGGDVRVGLGGAANAIVFVRMFQGNFSADFPIQLPEGQANRSGSKRFNFTLGSGSARIEVQTFRGNIHLARTKVTAGEPARNRQSRAMRLDALLSNGDIERLTSEALSKAGMAMKDLDWTAIEQQIERSLEPLRERGFIVPEPPVPPAPPPTPPTPPRPPAPPRQPPA
jgi:DUF4097 and DUF4098 domain-containing protein YvlB